MTAFNLSAEITREHSISQRWPICTWQKQFCGSPIRPAFCCCGPAYWNTAIFISYIWTVQANTDKDIVDCTVIMSCCVWPLNYFCHRITQNTVFDEFRWIERVRVMGRNILYRQKQKQIIAIQNNKQTQRRVSRRANAHRAGHPYQCWI